MFENANDTRGVSQALVLAFASEALIPQTRTSTDAAFDAWSEAYAVIASRTPHVHDWDDADDPYRPAESTDRLDRP